MPIIYDLIFLIIAIIYLPIYLYKKKLHLGLFRRLGMLPKNLELDRPIWIHAVSVGEVMAIRGLVEELRKVYPEKKFVISTVTATGNKIAKNIAGVGDFVTYLPLDISFVVRSVVDRINPSIFIIAETEIWPNLISYLYRKKIPIVTVNGRVSDVSLKGYLSIRFLLKPILNKISIFCVQGSLDAQRFKTLGVPEEKVKITGNMKFDIKDPAHLKKDYTDYRLKLGLDPKDKLFIAGSTHPGEEEIILGIYKEIQIDFPNLKLLIAPRHPQRTDQIVNSIKKFGFEPIRISLLSKSTNQQINKSAVFILDTVGQLSSFYTVADVVFVGGSLIKKGGHNILEPASLEKPVLFGPYMFNFRDIVDLFLNNKAAIMVLDQEDLKTNITRLLNNPSWAIELGRRARQLILRNQGATKRNLEYIR